MLDRSLDLYFGLLSEGQCSVVTNLNENGNKWFRHPHTKVHNYINFKNAYFEHSRPLSRKYVAAFCKQNKRTLVGLLRFIKCSEKCACPDWSERVCHIYIKHAPYVTRVHFSRVLKNSHVPIELNNTLGAFFTSVTKPAGLNFFPGSSDKQFIIDSY